MVGGFFFVLEHWAFSAINSVHLIKHNELKKLTKLSHFSFITQLIRKEKKKKKYFFHKISHFPNEVTIREIFFLFERNEDGGGVGRKMYKFYQDMRII